MKKVYILLLVVFTIFLVSCGSSEFNEEDATYTGSIEEENIVNAIDLDKVAYESYEEESCVVLDGESESYYITEEGSYILRGNITDTIIINVDEEEDVRLILDDVTIISEYNSAILVLSADDIEISVPEGTTNYIEDSSVYANDYSSYNSAIYSEADLLINGTGSLEVIANYNNGIQTKDDLIIIDLTLSISSVDDGIIGRDSLTIQNANVTIDSVGDCLKTTYTTDDDTETDKGYLQIISGNITLSSEDDGLSATSNVIITGGIIEINADSQGVSSDDGFYYYNGSMSIESKEDAVHVVNLLSISGGSIEISTDDDALHSDCYLYISDGTINIVDSFEGIEGKYIYISGGNINVNAEDDGINGSDPNVSILDAAKPGEEADPETSTALIEISGGVIYIESEDDSIDSNGILNISGGLIIVDGPTSGTQSAFDYDIEFNLTGGTLIAVAGYGVETKTPTEDSTQISLMYNLGYTKTSGTTVTLIDDEGNIVVSFTPKKSYQAIIISTPDLDSSTTYTLCLGGDVSGTEEYGIYLSGTITNYQTVESFTLSDITNTFNDTSSDMVMPGRR